jgi:arylsulfatase A
MIKILQRFIVLSSVLILNTFAAGDKPNIVLVLVDDLGWTDLSCQGSTYFETPHIDALASEGVRFTSGYAACAVCSPTRAAVQTGRYPHRTGVTDWIRARFQGGTIPEDKKNPCWLPQDQWKGKKKMLVPPNALWLEREEQTLAEMLKPAGYTSCYIGKWHLGADDWYPETQGYDFNFGGCDIGQPPSYFDPYKNRIPNLPGRQEGQYLTDREADEAVAFIEKHKDQPFFLMLANYCVHTPIQAKADVKAKYEAKPKTNQKNAAYAAMVESVDDAVGRVRATLDALKLSDNTLVIFTSDNGGLVGPTHNAPLRSGKGHPFEGGIRVPFIVTWPGVAQAGVLSDEPVISMDIKPTIAAAAGVKLPDDVAIDGLNLKAHLKGSAGLDRQTLYWHFPHYRHAPGPYSIIRDGDFKMIKWYEGQTLLFNIKEDIGEATDLAGSMPEKVSELDRKLMAHLRATTDRIPIPNPTFASKP